MNRKPGDLTIRQATVEDAPIVVWASLAALVDGEPEGDPVYDYYRSKAYEVCYREDTLQSYRNALVAEVDGAPAGAIISYPGDIYEQSRKITLEIYGPSDFRYDSETFPGEYYLDSLAVKKEFREMGIGTSLMEAAAKRAAQMGYSCVSLIVSDEKPYNRRMYEHLGFRADGPVVFMDEPYTRMVKDI